MRRAVLLLSLVACSCSSSSQSGEPAFGDATVSPRDGTADVGRRDGSGATDATPSDTARDVGGQRSDAADAGGSRDSGLAPDATGEASAAHDAHAGQDSALVPDAASEASAGPDASGPDADASTSPDAGSGELLAAIATNWQNGVRQLVVDDSGIYVAGIYGLYYVPPTGGSATVLCSGVGIGDIAADSTYVYAIYRYYPQSAMRIPKAGGAFSNFATGNTSVAIQEPSHLSVNDTNLYFFDGLGIDVYEAPLVGGAISPLLSVYATDLALADDRLYFGTNSQVGAASTFGSLLGSVAAGPVAVAVDSVNVYWTDAYSFFSVPRAALEAGGADAGSVTTLATGAASGAGAMVTDGANLYVSSLTYTTAFPGAVLRVAVTGGEITTIATGPGGPNGIAVDSSYVYYLFDDGLYRLPKQ